MLALVVLPVVLLAARSALGLRKGPEGTSQPVAGSWGGCSRWCLADALRRNKLRSAAWRFGALLSVSGSA